MQLSFVYLPVANLKAALALYRDTLGFEEAWREGDFTCGLQIPGTAVQLMLDQDTPAGDKAGPFFEVDDVDGFFAEHEGKLAFNAPPKDIPPGRYTSFDDPWGNRIHVLDTSKSR
ncbi:MAG: VOC family protein [Trueperaceae bacterium]